MLTATPKYQLSAPLFAAGSDDGSSAVADDAPDVMAAWIREHYIDFSMVSLDLQGDDV